MSLDDVPATTAAADTEAAVRARYSAGAQAVEASLCCPTDYDPRYLEILPAEILQKDYGCGDPSAHVGAGETVLDLGSGAGKICYILAQKVGAAGRVLGVDMNDDMLALARRHQPEIAAKLGYDNVTFRKGRIQDLQLNLEAVDAWLRDHPAGGVDGMFALEAECGRLRREAPLVASDSVDVVVSNCVLNLVRPEQKAPLFAEIFRVLRRGGRAVISDIVCDETPTAAMQADPELWSGCISGAFREDEFLQRFADAGFYGIEILARQAEPWQVVEGIEFRSLTVRAYKGKEGPCLERNQAVVYRGPWKTVTDDDGHTYHRGERMAVCDKTFGILTAADGPYAGQLDGIAPRETVPLEQAQPFNCQRQARRDPRVTKGADYDASVPADGSACGPDDCC